MKGREQTNQHREDANSEAAPCNLGGLLQLSSAAARATRRATANAMGKQEADSILLKVKSTLRRLQVLVRGRRARPPVQIVRTGSLPHPPRSDGLMWVKSGVIGA